MAAPRRRQLAQRRKALGYTQERLAERLRVDRSTVVRWERGNSEPQPWYRRPLADALDITLDRLDDLLADVTAPAIGPSRVDRGRIGTTTVSTAPIDGSDTVDRRQFTVTAALGALGVAGPLRTALESPAAPRTLGGEHVRGLTETIGAFEKADAALGGDALCEVALNLHQRVGRWTRESSFPPGVGAGLQAALGDLEVWIGWLSVDAERRPQARRYLQDTILRARLIDDPVLEVRAMGLYALLVREARPAESLQCAEAALRLSAPWATPRLTTLLHLRAGHALAIAGDAVAAERNMARARAAFDRGPHADDPAHLRFVTGQEVTGLAALSQLALDRPERAARLLRGIAEHPHPVYRRNAVLYHLHLAEATRRARDVTGASAIALRALPAVLELRSARTRRRCAELRAALGTYASRVPAAREFTEAYDAAVAPVGDR